MKTKQRDFVLSAPSIDEKTLWLYTLDWIIKENKRIEGKKKSQQEVAAKFKLLTQDQKALVLKKSYDLKQDLEKSMTSQEKSLLVEKINQIIKDDVDKYYNNTNLEPPPPKKKKEQPSQSPKSARESKQTSPRGSKQALSARTQNSKALSAPRRDAVTKPKKEKKAERKEPEPV